MGASSMPFGASAFSRRDRTSAGEFGDTGLGKSQAQSSQAPQQQAHSSTSGSNPLNDLTEEQREEINEAVSLLLFCYTNKFFRRASLHAVQVDQ